VPALKICKSCAAAELGVVDFASWTSAPDPTERFSRLVGNLAMHIQILSWKYLIAPPDDIFVRHAALTERQ